MSLAHARYKLTYDDYVQLSQDKRGELIDGYFIVSPSPSSRHQWIALKMGHYLLEWVENHDLGEVFIAPMDIKFSDNNTLQPDVFFIAKSRVSIIEENYIAGAPDFIIEILSPSTKQIDLTDKMLTYSTFGVREYWIIDPITEIIRVHDLKENQLVLREVFPKGSLIPSIAVDGFQFNSALIF